MTYEPSKAPRSFDVYSCLRSRYVQAMSRGNRTKHVETGALSASAPLPEGSGPDGCHELLTTWGKILRGEHLTAAEQTAWSNHFCRDHLARAASERTRHERPPH
jgi:hypothetical protein